MSTEAAAPLPSALPSTTPVSAPQPPVPPAAAHPSCNTPAPGSTDIRSLLHHYISTNHLDLPRQQQLLSRLRHAGLISTPSSYQHTTGLIRPNKRYLQIYVDAGEAFVDEFIDDALQPSPPALLTLSLHFLRHRYASHPVVARVAPSFKHTFLFPLQGEDDPLPLASLPSLLALSSPLHVALTRSDSQGTALLATASVEWREVLVHGSVAVKVSLFSEDDPTRPIGLLPLALSLIPLRLPSSPSALPVFVESAAVKARVAADLQLSSLIAQRFHAYTAAWWQELRTVHAPHAHRSLPLFLPSDCGDPAFVCTLLAPLRAAGGVESALHAARFVRLLAFRREMRVGGQRREVVHSLNALCARRSGDVEDHTFLLCSLLLGFGLDAYVAAGTNPTGAHMVVVTRQGGGVTLWDAVTGHRYIVPAATPRHRPEPRAPPPLHRVHCVFNGGGYWANAQVEDDVHLVAWDVRGQGWQAMKAEAIAVLPRRAPFPLQACAVDAGAAAGRLEGELRGLVAAYRRQVGDLATVWGEELGQWLAPALASYEAERVTGVKLFEEEFQAAIQHSTPEQSVFRAVPFQFIGLEAGSIMAAMVENEDFVVMAQEGGKGMGDGLQFGIRVKVVPYAEEVMAVWVVIASIFVYSR